jgi:hypothetical protein
VCVCVLCVKFLFSSFGCEGILFVDVEDPCCLLLLIHYSLRKGFLSVFFFFDNSLLIENFWESFNRYSGFERCKRH